MSASQAVPPSSFARVSSGAAPRPETARVAPSAFRRRATASPIPPSVEAPRTIATLPFKSPIAMSPFQLPLPQRAVSRLNAGRRPFMHGQRTIGPLPLNRVPAFVVTLVEQFQRERMGPDEEFLVLNPLRHELSDELRRQAVGLQGRLVLWVALGWSAQFAGTIAARVPGIGIDDPRTEDAETDAAAVFQAECIGETQDRMLGRHVGRQSDRRRADRVMRAGIANPRLFPALQKAPAEGSTAEKYPKDIDLELPAQVLLGSVEARTGRDDAGVVAQDFDMAQGLPGEIGQGLHGFGATHVAAECRCRDAECADLRSDGFGFFRLDIGNDDAACTRPRQRQCNAPSDAAAGAGDDGPLSRNVHDVLPPQVFVYGQALRDRQLRITNGYLVSGLPQIHTVFVCTHSLMASMPPSRPMP